LLAALASLAAGLLFIWIDLGHPERVWRVYTDPNFNSVMAQIVWAYTAFGALTLLALVLHLRKAGDALLSVVMVVGIPLALFLSSAVGALLGVAAARPFWHVGLFPVQFPVFSVASAAAMLMVLIAFVGPREDSQRRQLLGILAVTSIGLQTVKLFFLWADLSQSYYGGAPQNQDAIEALVSGEYWWAFWVLQILIGSVLPILILVRPRFAQQPGWSLTAGVMILFGLVVARMNILLPALVVPQLEGLESAYVNPHLSLEYFPSVMEWQVFVFILALAMGGFLVVYRLLPAFSREEADA
jgi:molybdopterin-containing oxidoreductase family membrane subunit